MSSSIKLLLGVALGVAGTWSYNKGHFDSAIDKAKTEINEVTQ